MCASGRASEAVGVGQNGSLRRDSGAVCRGGKASQVGRRVGHRTGAMAREGEVAEARYKNVLFSSERWHTCAEFM